MDEFAQRLRRGESPSIEEYEAAHPDSADEIRELFPSIRLMEQLAGQRERERIRQQERAIAQEDLPEQLGEFRIIRDIGRGGMGDVYLAEQVSLKRHVALKLLRPDFAANADYLRRFVAEAETVARIRHRNIVSVLAVGEHQGFHYIAMEYVKGKNLLEFIELKGTMDVPLCLAVMSQVAAALARAAEEGIVHRDVKPGNVLLTKSGEAKVTDFGLARQLTGENTHLTKSGVTVGTPTYMSPEQIEGKTLDARTDIYSFGVMCYHMLAGQPPFAGETAAAVAAQHLKDKPTPLGMLRPDAPKELIRIVEKMMVKDRKRRYQSAREVLYDLRQLREELAGRQETESRQNRGMIRKFRQTMSKWRRRRS